MERDNAEPSPGAQERYGVLQRLAQRRQLVVDGNAQRLKRLLRGVARIPVAHFARNGGVYRAHQVARGRKRRARAMLHNHLGNARGPCFLAVVAQHAGNLLLAPGVDQFLCVKGLPPVHAHVQRRVRVVGKPPFGRVQLIGGDAQIQQNAVHGPNALRLKERAQVVKVSVQGVKIPVLCQAHPGGVQRVLVSVHAEYAGARAQQRLAVSASAQRAVHKHPARRRGQEFDNFPKHHRLMLEHARAPPFGDSFVISGSSSASSRPSASVRSAPAR